MATQQKDIPIVDGSINSGKPFGSGPGSYTPTPVAPTTPTLVDRYAQGSGIIDASQNNTKDFGSGPGSYTPTDTGAEREMRRSQAMATVNAIRQKTDEMITADTEAKKRLEVNAELSTLAGGRAGSPSGATEQFNASTKGQEAINKHLAERENKINQVLSNADTRASADFEKNKTEFLKKQQDQKTAQEKITTGIQTKAKDEIKQLAGYGLTYDDLVSKYGKNRADQYAKDLGTDETGVKLEFIKNKPANTKVFEKHIGNHYVIGYKDPVTGAISTESVPLPADGNSKNTRLQMIDNKPYFVNLDTKTLTPAEGYSGKPVIGAPQGIDESNIQKARSMLETVGSYNGYANPYLYKQLYQDWVQKGGDRATFTKYFPPATYINPSHKALKDETGQSVIPENIFTQPTSLPTDISTSKTSSGKTY